MTSFNEDETFRKLSQADFQIVFECWMDWVTNTMRPREADFNDVLRRHGWTNKEFAEELKQRYYGNKSLPL